MKNLKKIAVMVLIAVSILTVGGIVLNSVTTENTNAVARIDPPWKY